MKTARRRAIAKAVNAKYYRRSDGCLCLRYKVSGMGAIDYPWYPTFPLNKFLAKIREIH